MNKIDLIIWRSLCNFAIDYQNLKMLQNLSSEHPVLYSEQEEKRLMKPYLSDFYEQTSQLNGKENREKCSYR